MWKQVTALGVLRTTPRRARVETRQGGIRWRLNRFTPLKKPAPPPSSLRRFPSPSRHDHLHPPPSGCSPARPLPHEIRPPDPARQAENRGSLPPPGFQYPSRPGQALRGDATCTCRESSADRAAGPTRRTSPDGIDASLAQPCEPKQPPCLPAQQFVSAGFKSPLVRVSPGVGQRSPRPPALATRGGPLRVRRRRFSEGFS